MNEAQRDEGEVQPELEAILDFWSGPLEPDGTAREEFSARWWTKSEQLDRDIRDRFGALHARLNAGYRPQGFEHPRGLLAGIIILDQFTRNMYRDTPAMYCADSLALALSFEALGLGFDSKLPFAHRVFVYMPLMHSERLSCQDRCVEIFRELANSQTGSAKSKADKSLDFARQHRDIVARFGRFPHRNRLLGRESTEEEKAFLETPGSSF